MCVCSGCIVTVKTRLALEAAAWFDLGGTGRKFSSSSSRCGGEEQEDDALELQSSHFHNRDSGNFPMCVKLL